MKKIVLQIGLILQDLLVKTEQSPLPQQYAITITAQIIMIKPAFMHIPRIIKLNSYTH